MISARMPAVRAYRRFGWRRRPGPLAGSITVAGFHGAVLGLGEAARGVVSALGAIGVTARAWDVSERLGHARRLDIGDTTPPPAGPGVLIAHMNPPELLQLVSTESTPFEGKYVIGYWAWELEALPALWTPAFRYVDEIWAPSRFTADVVRRAAPRDLTVRVVPHPVAVTNVAADRARFGLDPERVIVLVAFDLRSTLARKNPLAALETFRRAIAQARHGATLVIKTVGGGEAPDLLARLRSAIGDTPDVMLIDHAMSVEDRDQLVASCDVFLSLHRSEGFGLLLAEAMAAGKAVIATAWSGNLDFMDDDCAVLAPYRLIPVDDPQGLYKGGSWAEVDVEAASRMLAHLIDDPDRRATLGRRAQAKVRERLDTPVVAEIMRQALQPGPDRRTVPRTRP